MKNVIIFGSCVSRDIFERDKKNFSIKRYFARSSFASSFLFKPIEDFYSEKIESLFQRRVVNYDLQKKAKIILAEESVDIILIDFIDERFDLFVSEDYCGATLSNELKSSGISIDNDSFKLIKSFSEEHFSLWKRGWDNFIVIAKREKILKKILINKTYCAESLENGCGFDKFPPGYIKKMNDFLRDAYSYISKDIPVENFIESAEEDLVGNSENIWGIAPYHYIDSFYINLLENFKDFSMMEDFIKSKQVVKIDKNSDNILSEIFSDFSNSELLYYFYLCKDGRVIRKSAGWSSDSSINFNLIDSGIYFVQGYVKYRDKKKIIYSDTVLHLNSGDTEKFNNYYNNACDIIDYPVERYFKNNYPYKDFVVFGSRSNDVKDKLYGQDFLEFINSNNLKIKISENGCNAVLFDFAPGEGNILSKKDNLFSGHMFYYERLVFGGGGF